ncbi:hypothetical protein BASA81_010610 [Batrachochytrium salamandrivorans]|nr:hypothetical protein BASA81_010610 [Batrachochytrium salamandrivorans]
MGGGSANFTELSLVAKDRHAFQLVLQSEERKRNFHMHRLRRRMQRQIKLLKLHLHELVAKLRTTESQLLDSIQRVNVAAMRKLHVSHLAWNGYATSWTTPFLMSLAMLVTLSAYFTKLYRKATGGGEKEW